MSCVGSSEGIRGTWGLSIGPREHISGCVAATASSEENGDREAEHSTEDTAMAKGQPPCKSEGSAPVYQAGSRCGAPLRGQGGALRGLIPTRLPAGPALRTRDPAGWPAYELFNT